MALKGLESPAAFVFFPALPPEIRHLIWSFAAVKTKNQLTLKFKKIKNAGIGQPRVLLIPRNNSCPVLMRTTSESRAIVSYVGRVLSPSELQEIMDSRTRTDKLVGTITIISIRGVRLLAARSRGFAREPTVSSSKLAIPQNSFDTTILLRKARPLASDL